MRKKFTQSNNRSVLAATCMLFTAASFAQQTSDLIISEYVEGSSNNKAIEIFNGTGTTIDLSNYSLKKQTNGAGEFKDEYALKGMLENGKTFVLAHSSSVKAILDVANENTNAYITGFNGNDAVALYKNGTQIDMVGIANDKADWGKDVTLRRKSNILSPSTTYSATDWEQFAIDSFDDLGKHTLSAVAALSAPTFQHFDLGNGYNNTDPFFLAKAVKITNANEKGNVYYTIDGSEPTAESTLYNFEANGPIAFEETTTLKAIVIDGDKKSSVTSATYTAFPKENIFMSVSDIKKKGTSATDFIAFAPNSFYYLFGGANNHYISDGENNILVYGSNIFPENVTAGASLTGTLMGHYENYYGLSEITDVQVVKNIIESEFDDPINVIPSELTASEIISNYTAHEHKLVTVKGIKAVADGTFSTSSASNISFAEGDKNIVVRNNFKTLTSEIKKDGVYNITGFVASNETKEGVTNYQIFPRTNADIVEASETGITETIAANLTVTTTTGAAVIVANEATPVNIYAIAGQLVKTLTVQAGTTVVELPTGVYVIAGIKVVIL